MFAELIRAEQRAFDGGLRRVLRVHAPDAGAVHDRGHAFAAQVARLAHGCAGGVAGAFEREFSGRAEPDDQHARGGDAVRRMKSRINDCDVVQPAAEIAEGEHAADRAADRLIDGAGRTARRLHTFEQIDDQRVGCDRLNRLMSEGNAHARILWRDSDSPGSL